MYYSGRCCCTLVNHFLCVFMNSMVCLCSVLQAPLCCFLWPSSCQHSTTSPKLLLLLSSSVQLPQWWISPLSLRCGGYAVSTLSAVCPRFKDSFSCDVGAHLCLTGLDLLPFAVTFLLSFWQVQYGIIGGVATSGVLLLYNVARPQIKVLVHHDISKDKANLISLYMVTACTRV